MQHDFTNQHKFMTLTRLVFGIANKTVY